MVTYFDYSRNMESTRAVTALSALAHAQRLAVFRLLVSAGPGGLAAGEISRRLDVLPNTLSANLGILSRAGLVRSRRDGRFVIYEADYAAMTGLLGFLVEDCCAGSAQVCAPLAEIAGRAACCPPQPHPHQRGPS